MEVNYLKRYVWLINTLLSQGPLSFPEISDLWKRSCLGIGEPLSKKTFHNHKQAIESLFDLSIACDRRMNLYYIKNPEALAEDEVMHWLFNLYSTLNQMQTDHTLRHRIMLEDVPSGQRWLMMITQAMHDNRRLSLTYQGFESVQCGALRFAPFQPPLVSGGPKTGTIQNLCLRPHPGHREVGEYVSSPAGFLFAGIFQGWVWGS